MHSFLKTFQQVFCGVLALFFFVFLWFFIMIQYKLVVRHIGKSKLVCVCEILRLIFVVIVQLLHNVNSSIDSFTLTLSLIFLLQTKLKDLQVISYVYTGKNIWKHPTRQFYKISVLGGMVSGKIVFILTKSWESSHGKFDLFLWYFFLLENVF